MYKINGKVLKTNKSKEIKKKNKGNNSQADHIIETTDSRIDKIKLVENIVLGRFFNPLSIWNGSF